MKHWVINKIDNTHQPSKNNVEGHSNNVTNNVKQKSENAKDEVSHNFNKDK